MNDLQILKDIIGSGVCDSCAFNLKQEAIKWIQIRESDKKKDLNTFYNDGKEKDWECKIDDKVTRWIKHFFNITEEDLK